MRALLLAGLVALAGLVNCDREDGQPDPKAQVLVPCDPHAPDGDPLACPPGAIDAGVDAPADAPLD
ncbi:MAG: hypothetical protein JWO36_3021 [Myxococcales bacterium]|nr:hypothetical protein [Myxococcales bacterium]